MDRYNGYQKSWHRDINADLCAAARNTDQLWGVHCGSPKSGGGWESICPSQACINPWGNCRCYTKIIDDSLTGVWPTRGVAQRFEQSLPQCIIEDSGRISNPACQHCDMNTPSRSVYRNSDYVLDYGGLNWGTFEAKGNCPAFVLKVYAVGTSWARWLWLTCSYSRWLWFEVVVVHLFTGPLLRTVNRNRRRPAIGHQAFAPP